MSIKSMADVAYDIMSSRRRAIQFPKLWEEVTKITGASMDRIGQFYNDLSLDSRFVSLKDNKWDLTERRTYDETHIDIDELNVDDDEEESEENLEEDEEAPEIMSDEDEY